MEHGTYSDGSKVAIEGRRGGFTYITFEDGARQGVTCKVPSSWVTETESDAPEHLAAFTLQDEWQGGAPVAVGTWDGTTWNGSPVPILSAHSARRYWEDMAAADRNGTWADTLPFVAADGTLHLPAHDAPEDRDEDMVWTPRPDGRYAVDGLVWSVLGDDGREG